MNKIFYKKDGTVRLLWAIFILYFNKKVKPLYHPDQGKDMLMLAVVFEITRLGVSVGKRFFASESLLSDGVIGLIFLLLAPEGAGADHLKALARVSRLLRNQAVCEKLRAAPQAATLFALLTEPTAAQAA